MTKVLSINTFGALVSSLCTFIFKKKKENKKSLLFSSLISCCTTRLLLHKPGHKEGSKSRHTDFSTSPFPPSCCLQQKQLREVSRRLCRLPSPSILYLTVPDCRPCALQPWCVNPVDIFARPPPFLPPLPRDLSQSLLHPERAVGRNKQTENNSNSSSGDKISPLPLYLWI